jgi:hypothetical protein
MQVESMEEMGEKVNKQLADARATAEQLTSRLQVGDADDDDDYGKVIPDRWLSKLLSILIMTPIMQIFLCFATSAKPFRLMPMAKVPDLVPSAWQESEAVVKLTKEALQAREQELVQVRGMTRCRKHKPSSPAAADDAHQVTRCCIQKLGINSGY